MFLVEPNNLVSILVISLYLFACSFFWLLPLYTLLKKATLAWQFVIPVSLSIQILFSYVFYTFELSNYYFWPYVAVVTVVNLWAIRRVGAQKLLKRFKTIHLTFSLKQSALILLLLVTTLYSRFYDSFSTLAPGNNDTYNHVLFLKSIEDKGYIQLTYYAPGYHLLLLPLTTVLPYSELYRFVGPVTGILTVLAIWLLVKPALKNRYSQYVLLGLLNLPVFNQLILQTIGFFSSSLTFIWMTAFLMLLGFGNNQKLPFRYAITLILTLAMSVTVPYFFVQYTASLLVLVFIALLFKKRFPRKFILRLLLMTAISACGLFAGYLHVMLQTSIHSNTYFPVISSAISEDINSSSISSNFEFIGNESVREFLTGTVLPLTFAGYDIIKIKVLREANSLLSIGAYVWMLVVGAMALYGIKKKRKSLIVLSILSFVYGFITQTGMVEMTTYKGRSGWYFLLLATLGMTFYFDRINIGISRKFISLGMCVISLSIIIWPPTYYRPYHSEQYEILNEYISNHEVSVVYSFVPEIGLVSENLEVRSISQEVVSQGMEENSVVILNKVMPEIDPVLSQQALATDKDFQNFNAYVYEAKEKQYQVVNYYLESGNCAIESRLKETETTIFCLH